MTTLRVFFFHFYPCAGALSTLTEISLRCGGKHCRGKSQDCLPLWNCDDGWQAFPLYKIQAYTAYSSLLVPVVAASCLVMGPVEPREGQIRMLGA